MYSELFDQLGASGRLNNQRDANAGGGDGDNEPAPLVAFKAGQMELTPVEAPTAAAAAVSGSFQCTPLKTRGEVRLVWKDRALQWQFYNRRDKKVQDTYKVQDYAAGSKLERIDLGDSKKHAQDRIYVWTRLPKTITSTATTSSSSVADGESKEPEPEEAVATAPPQPDYQMYWMQDAADDKDEEIVAKVNQYLADPDSARPAGEAAADNAAAMDTETTTTGASGSAAASAGTSGGAGTAGTSTNQSQVDALSSILENLGMPQAGSSSSGGTGGGAGGSGTGGGSSAAAGGSSGTAAAAATNTLTLADLQGAMAGIQQQQQQVARPAPSLADIVTPEAITALLQDDAVRDRLLQLLPEEQRTAEHLEANMRSPQVQQTLRALTATLLPDDAGDLTGMYTVLANFQLDSTTAGTEAVRTGNPILAFLNALQASVDKDKAEKEEAAEGSAGDDDAQKDETKEESKDAGNDNNDDEAKDAAE